MSDACQVRRVLIVEDHPIVATGLRTVLEQDPELTVCGACHDADSAIEAVARFKPDLILMDVSLGGEDGLRLLRRILVRWPEMRVLVVSMHDEVIYAPRALQAGARGFIMKEEPLEELMAAIRAVLQGGRYLSPHLEARRNPRDVAGPGLLNPLECLSNRELQVFRMIGSGMSLRQIAADLNLSLKTVETHRDNIRRKLCLVSAQEVIRHAMAWAKQQT